MNKEKIAYDEYFSQVNKVLGSSGLLLAAGEPGRPTRPMGAERPAP